MRFAALLLLCLVAIPTAAAQTSKKSAKPQLPAENQRADEAYDFKGIRLGMTLSEFKAAPVPDQTEYEYCYMSDGAYGCSDRRTANPVPDCSSTQGVGTVTCTWVYRKA